MVEKRQKTIEEVSRAMIPDERVAEVVSRLTGEPPAPWPLFRPLGSGTSPKPVMMSPELRIPDEDAPEQKVTSGRSDQIDKALESGMLFRDRHKMRVRQHPTLGFPADGS